MSDDKKRKKAREDWDDGRTIAPMNGDELPFYRRAVFSNRKNKAEVAKEPQQQFTKKERRAMVRAYFALMLPRLLVILLSFGLVAALLALWLM